MDELLEQFLIEGRELIAEAGAHLQALSTAPSNAARHIDAAFRAFHTLKGSVGLFDMAPAGRVLHAGEDVLEGARGNLQASARQDNAALDGAALDGLVACIDLVDHWIDAFEAQGCLPADAAARASQLVGRLAAGATREAASAQAPAAQAAQPQAGTMPGWLEAFLASAEGIAEAASGPAIAFRYAPDAGCFFRGEDPLKLVMAVPELLALRISPHTPWPDLAEMAPFDCRIVVEGLSAGPEPAVRAALRPAGEQAEIVAVPDRRSMPDPALPGPALHDATMSDAAAAEARLLRVDAHRIAALGDDLGELVLAGNALDHIARTAGLEPALAARLRQVQGEFARGLASLQRNLNAARAVSLAPALRRLPRMAREIAAGLGREVAFTIAGEETEVDKAIADMLFEPLLHLLRNALDHGIEAPPARLAAGKPAQGRVTLDIARRGEAIVITLADDGAGIDPVRVRSTAVARGLLTSEQAAAMADDAALQLIFRPGFSTAAAVTGISGRGVGMDAVKAAAEAAGGSVALQTRLGQGTTTTLALPVRALTTRLLLVAIGGEWFGVPLQAILETATIAPERIQPVGAGFAFILRDRTLPVLRLAERLGLEARATGNVAVFIVQVGDERVALAVDGFGEQIEVMIRPPARLLTGIPALAGTAMRGDGRVLLVLDPARLLA
jgi:two-component system chemotaxis sensor kinase CheA